MKLSRNMRRRIRSLTRRQLLAYILLDGAARIEGTEVPVKDMTKTVLGDIIISWGCDDTPDSIYKQVKDAKALADSDDELFLEFYKKHTPPMEDMVERQRAIQRELHQKRAQEGNSNRNQAAGAQ